MDASGIFNPSINSNKDISDCHNACLHCQRTITQRQTFCCQGCEAAYNICSQGIHNAQDSYASFVHKDNDNLLHLTLNIENIHCIGCVQHIQSTLLKETNIVTVRVSVSTKRIYLVWHGTAEQADYFVHLITHLGYSVSPTPVIDTQGTQDAYEKSCLYGLAVAGFGMVVMLMLMIGLWSLDKNTQAEMTHTLLSWLSALIALPVIAYSGKVFFDSAFTALKNKHTNIDIPISLGIILSSFISICETVTEGKYIYFTSVIMLIFCLLLGRYLDTIAKGKARKTAQTLIEKLYSTASIIQDDAILSISIQDLMPDMIVRVLANEIIPADGEIITGKTQIDTHLITGDKNLISVGTGGKVLAGSMNVTENIDMRVTTLPQDSILSKIIQSLESAEHTQSKYVLFANKIIAMYIPAIHCISLFAFMFWWGYAGLVWQKSLMIAISILIITCPCALAIGVPVVHSIAIRRLLKKGILIQSNMQINNTLERLKGITHILIDDTTLEYNNKDNLKNILQNKGLQIILLSVNTSDISLTEQIAFLKSCGHRLLVLSNSDDITDLLTHSDIFISFQTHTINPHADIICFHNDLSLLADIYDTAHKTHSLVKQNFIIACVYNILAIPLAFFGYITPIIAASAMSLSSLAIITNSIRVLYKKVTLRV